MSTCSSPCPTIFLKYNNCTKKITQQISTIAQLHQIFFTKFQITQNTNPYIFYIKDKEFPIEFELDHISQLYHGIIIKIILKNKNQTKTLTTPKINQKIKTKNEKHSPETQEICTQQKVDDICNDFEIHTNTNITDSLSYPSLPPPPPTLSYNISSEDTKYNILLDYMLSNNDNDILSTIIYNSNSTSNNSIHSHHSPTNTAIANETIPNVPIVQQEIHTNEQTTEHLKYNDTPIEMIDYNSNAYIQNYTIPNGHIIRMLGVPYTATVEDILHFFHNLKIVFRNGIFFTHNVNGNRIGEVFIIFQFKSDQTKAMELHNKHIGNRYIEIFYTTIVKFNQSIKISKGIDIPADSSEAYVVKMKGFSFEASEDKIMEFMATVNIIPLQIYIIYDYKNRNSGITYAVLRTEYDINVSHELNHKYLGSRYINIYTSNIKHLRLSLAQLIGCPLPYNYNPYLNCIKIEGIPVNVSDHQSIVDIFAKIKICPKKLHINLYKNIAYAEFCTPYDCQLALTRNGSLINKTPIYLIQVNKYELRNVIGGSGNGSGNGVCDDMYDDEANEDIIKRENSNIFVDGNGSGSVINYDKENEFIGDHFEKRKYQKRFFQKRKTLHVQNKNIKSAGFDGLSNDEMINNSTYTAVGIENRNLRNSNRSSIRSGSGKEYDCGKSLSVDDYGSGEYYEEVEEQLMCIRGIPYDAKIKDLYEFFSEYSSVDKNSVRFFNDHRGRFSGQATVLFKDRSEAEHALQEKHRQYIGNRYVLLKFG